MNEAGINEIPDDPTSLPDLLMEMKRQYRTHVTRDYNFRITQLRSLSNGLTAMKDEICEAVEKDLGRSAF